MLRPRVLILIAVGLLVGGAASATAPFVFVSNPDGGQIVKVLPDGTTEILFQQNRIDVQDLVVGPDDLLYACAPEDQLVFRFDPLGVVPGSPYGLADTEIVFDGSTAGPETPQCGWFSDRGDLFVTDSDEAVWVFNNLVPLDPMLNQPPVLPATPSVLVFQSDVGPFQGQGVTQAAPGDLLFVNGKKNSGAVWSLAFDPIFRFEAPGNAPQVLIENLDEPVGVARSGNGTVFVATDNGLEGWTEDDGAWSQSCFAPSSSFGNQDPQFLALTADDTLYVTTDSKKAATLWQVDTDCTIVDDIVIFERPVWKPSMSGVAVPRTDRIANGEPGTLSDLYFNFKDHTYELSIIPDPDQCTVTDNSITATETAPECVRVLFEDRYVVIDNNNPIDAVTGVPVTYAGDGGVAQVYTVEGSCNPDLTEFIEHAISAYSALVANPRTVRCVFPAGFDVCNPPPLPTDPPPPDGNGTAYCELISLDSFFPFNGVFPDDGRIGSRGTTSFSEYFFADITLAEDATNTDNTPGCFCGFEDPLTDIDMLDPIDPSFGLASFNAGSAVPIKFRIAALPANSTCEMNICATTPEGYVTGAQVLLSVARIFDENADGVFEPVRPAATGGSNTGILFGNPNNPNTPYHFNLDTAGYQPGVYQAVAVALTDNFAVEWVYFALN